MLSSNLPVSHDVYVHRTGQSSFRTKGVYPGLSTAPTRPGSWARLLCNGPGHTQHLQEQQREQPEPLKPPKRPEEGSWRSPWPGPSCGAITECARAVVLNRKWMVQTREIAPFPQVELPKSGKGIQDFLVYAYQGEKKKPIQMLQTPRNPFIKDGKFFYTLFQNRSSIKS